MCNQSLFKWWCHLHIGEIIAKDNLNIENLMQTFENLLFQNYSTKFLDIKYKYSLGMCNQCLFKWWCHLHIGEIIAKDNLNIENLMQTFENLLLQNYSTKFLVITHK